MPAPQVKSKWRPRLALIVYSVLLSIMALPIISIIWFRTIDSTASLTTTTEAGALLGVLLVTLGVAYVLSRNITGPINALISRSDEIARGGRAAIQPLDSYGTNEIATLSQSFLDLASKLVDRNEYVRSFAAHVSHELKSPLTSIRGAAELMRDDDDEQPMTKEERQRFLDNIIADSKRLDLLLARLRELAYAEIPIPADQSTADDVCNMLRDRFPHHVIGLSGQPGIRFALPIEAAAVVFGNLAENAFQNGATRVDIEAQADVQIVRILVADNGNGILQANRERIFQPFFSTRRQDGGTGMGLEIARTMLASHGGDITLQDTGDQGAVFLVTAQRS
ncbi:HAMP domain-containing histidine kinase [Rhizobium sp. CG4]|jgi:signal transduction histidine kinase|uniref:HAMP domain-containing sensor histidine kinase n=1 Tax=Rhizobium sp. CG4 TaxID=2726075 RepID=UPI0020334056|nr:HAMP domain-containing sensor histidine kinase [Rhizobium sp. CG4]MCM2456595.1 HAMP domain-containing histidine kinase [Rhizobium sp. CG4]